MTKVLIDIPDDTKGRLSFGITYKSDVETLCKALSNGIVLDNLTNGEVMQKMFPDAKISFEEEWDSYDNGDICHPYVETFVNVDFGYEQIIAFSLDWWNRKWGE